MMRVLVPALVLCLAACAGEPSDDDGAADTDAAADDGGAVTLTLAFDSGEVGPGAPVHITVDIVNGTGEVARFGQGSSSCWADAVVVHADGTEEPMAAPRPCTADFVLRTLDPGGTRRDAWTWEGAVLRDGTPQPLPPGEYTLVPFAGDHRGPGVPVRVVS